MRSFSRRVFRVTAPAIVLAPLAVMAASEAPRITGFAGIASVAWETWLLVVGLSIGGWFMSSAETLAGWVDGEKDGLLKNRLKILKLFVMSLSAGFIAYLLGLVAGMPDIPNVISTLLAAYGGEQYLRKRVDALPPAPPAPPAGGDKKG